MKTANPKTIRKQSEKLKLIGIVEHLVQKLGRPICSNDVRAFCREHPDAAPLYLQRMGQCLIKAARPMPEPIPYLKKVGVIGNRAYYALKSKPDLIESLQFHKDHLRAVMGASWQIPEHARNLLGTEWDFIGNQACAGFQSEFRRLARLVPVLSAQMERARLITCVKFTLSTNVELISRHEARNLITTKAISALGRERAAAINFSSALCEWKWPQSHLFPPLQNQAYSPTQITLLCHCKWPSSDVPWAESLLQCSRYNVPSYSTGIFKC